MSMRVSSRKHAPGLDRLGSINDDGSRRHPEPADISGRFTRGRRAVYAMLMAIYVTLPFVEIGGDRAVHLDIPGRRFHLFGSVFNAQDGFRLLLLALTVAFGLLFVTAVWGRLWCGWACPQSVFIEGLFRPIERLIDGPREQRIRLRQQGFSPRRLPLVLLKHALYLAVAFLLAHALLALFVPLPKLVGMMSHAPGVNAVPFGWAMAVTGVLYFDGAWFREQFCVVLCPYGRLQSVLTDEHSLVIGYDAARGEPRRGKAAPEGRLSLPVVDGTREGDCVDCGRCVSVCPTAIDIRNGLQMECIGCAQCVDACDDVMDRLSRPRGLVRYDSLSGLVGHQRRRVRSRVVVYGLVFASVVTALIVTTVLRRPFEAELVRARGMPYVVDGDRVRNTFELHVVNKQPVAAELLVTTLADDGTEVTLPVDRITLGSLDDFRLPVVATRSRTAGSASIRLTVTEKDSGRVRDITAPLLGPVAH